MSQVGITRSLKRQISSDIEEAPVKQARTTTQNAYARRYPPHRRSDCQVLDINSTTVEVEHLPHTCDTVLVPSELQGRSKQGKDRAGSTNAESQDENAAWDPRAIVYRHNTLFQRPRAPASRVKRPRPAPLIQTVTSSEIALMESDSENEQLLETSNPYGTSEAASRKTQQLLALGAARATAFKRPQISTLPTNGVPALSVNKLAATISTASKSGVTTTNSVVGSARLQKSHSMTSLQQPQRQNKHVRQDAIDAIAGHRSTAVLSILSAATPTLSMTSSLSSMPSQILRRSRRIAARQ